MAMAAETWTGDKDLGISAQSTEDVRRALGLHGSPGREDREEAELWSSQMLTGEEGEANPVHTPEREQPVRKKGAVSQRPGGERVVSERETTALVSRFPGRHHQ